MKSFPAPAKINLHLKVTKTLANGYHELDTSFVYVDVEDRLTITPSDRLEVTCSKAELNGKKNLVYKVLEALQARANIAQGLAVHIDKKLPDQAGLGGGSSDAATALMVANAYWQLGLSAAELIAFATPFGADIPCFLFARASLAKGVGEQLSPYPEPLPDGHILLAYPGIGLSTPEVFHCYDRNNGKARALTQQSAADTIRDHSKTAHANDRLGSNDLESCACLLCREVDALLGAMRSCSDRAWMSGSGSTCVALFVTRQEAEQAAEMLRKRKLASWTHVGKLMKEHPLKGVDIGA